MSGDEVFVTIASTLLGPVAWVWWLFRTASIDSLRPHGRPAALLGAGVGFGGLLIYVVLRYLAADDVRNAPQYLVMYLVLGLAWMRLGAMLFPLAGLNPRDDLIERRNGAAVPAWMGAVIGIACCYAGGNVGNGPGWWVVVFSAVLATASLGFVWTVMAQRTGVMDVVTVDRDPAAGLRLGGLLSACGVVFGAAVMGDWVSVPSTIADFVARAWPALPIVLVAMLIERAMRPTPARPRALLLSGGVLPALLYLMLAGTAVMVPIWRLWTAS